MMDELKWVYGLTRATTEDNKRIAKLHTEIFGNGLHVCITCPSSIRDAVKRLKKYYEQQRD